MLVVLVIAAIAILAGVIAVVRKGGGELTEFPPDVPPLDLPEAGQLSAADFAALQLPVSLVGYHTPSVDETLRRAASAISARDDRIAVLERRITELLASRAGQEGRAAPEPDRIRTPWIGREPALPPLPSPPEEGPSRSDSAPGGGTEDPTEAAPGQDADHPPARDPK